MNKSIQPSKASKCQELLELIKDVNWLKSDTKSGGRRTSNATTIERSETTERLEEPEETSGAGRRDGGEGEDEKGREKEKEGTETGGVEKTDEGSDEKAEGNTEEKQKRFLSQTKIEEANL